MKAIIVDLKEKHAAALNEDGTIVRIANAGYQIGQSVEIFEIEHAEMQNRKRLSFRFTKTWRKITAAAAAFICLFGAGTATAYALPYGTVSVDGDPSIEYTINCFDYVLDVNAQNEEGDLLLSEIDLKELKHHKVETALAYTLEQMEKGGYLGSEDAAVAVTADTGNDRHTEQLQQKLEERIPYEEKQAEEKRQDDKDNLTDQQEQAPAYDNAQEQILPQQENPLTPAQIGEQKENSGLENNPTRQQETLPDSFISGNPR